ncbi:MAG: sodium/solute symporter [Bryobacteraceae bacterium]
MALTPLDFVVVLAYFGALAGIGLYFSRRQDSAEEYYLGGRKIHWLLAGGSVLATLLSTITYLSIPGEMIRYGITFFLGTLMIPLAAPVVNRVIMPAIRRQPIRSAYEYLEKRYGPGMKRLASIVFVTHTMVWSGIIFYTASLAVAQVAGWSLAPTIVVMGVVTVVYTTAGGIRTVIWTDNLQLLILFGGAAAIPVWVAMKIGTGPGAWWEAFSRAGHAAPVYFSWDPTVRLTVFGTLLSVFAWEMCSHSSDQVAVQRYLSTPGLDEARRTLWTYATFRILLGALLGFCGLALFAFYLARSGADVAEIQRQIAPTADRLMPRFIAEELPPGISGLLLAALLAAAMSSLSSAINSTSNVLSGDLFARAEGGSLAMDRWLSIGAGVLGMGIALTISAIVSSTGWNIVELTGRLNHIFVGPLAALFFAGVLLPKVTPRGAFLGFGAGTLLSLYICFSPISFNWVVPASVLTAVAVARIASK